MVSFTAIDFETASGPRHTASAVGIVRVVNNVIVSKYFTLIQPPDNAFMQGNSMKTGIKPRHTDNAATFPVLFPLINDLLGDGRVVCYSPFDEQVFNQSIDYFGLNADLKRVFIDVCVMMGGVSLDVASKKHHIELKHHDCLSDAEACARLYAIYHNSVIDDLVQSDTVYTSQPEGHNRIKGQVLSKYLGEVVDIENPFYNKKVVITGIFMNWDDRNDLASLLRALGADVDSSVTKATHYLITGSDPGPSKVGKMKTTCALREDAFILGEDELLKMLHGWRFKNNIMGIDRILLINSVNGSFFVEDVSF